MDIFIGVMPHGVRSKDCVDLLHGLHCRHKLGLTLIIKKLNAMTELTISFIFGLNPVGGKRETDLLSDQDLWARQRVWPEGVIYF